MIYGYCVAVGFGCGDGGCERVEFSYECLELILVRRCRVVWEE